ncbi:MAG: chorismate synthase [Promethearchaeota archaeon]
MTNTIGTLFKVTTWGESHGLALGCVVDGVPSNLPLSEDDIRSELQRDIPIPALGTQRKEPNDFQILSGVFEGKTLGTPISIVIWNRDVRSENYKGDQMIPRPGHADLIYKQKYIHVDWRGGSRASGRECIARLAGGAIAKKILKMKGIKLQSKIISMGGLSTLNKKELENAIEKIVKLYKEEGETTGGIVDLKIHNLPIGIGEPVFGKFNAELARAILSIPAVRGVEFGDGFTSAAKKATESNDLYEVKENQIHIKTNHSGGISGGISTGQTICLRLAIKPVPSIPKEQESIDLNKMKPQKFVSKGRFDINITPRIAVIVEAMAAIITTDLIMISLK